MVRYFNNIKRSICLVISVMLVFALSQTALATETEGSINLAYAVEGVDFDIYLVGNANDQGDFVLTGDFANYQVNLESEDAAKTLASYVESDNIKPMNTVTTDAECNAKFTNLSKGVYLIIGSFIEVDGMTYTPSPVMVSLPKWDNDVLLWDLDVKGKYRMDNWEEIISISALKVWKDDGNKEARPNEISVSLTKNGEVYDTVKLTKDNNWTYKWKNLDGSSSWAIIEENVPSGYEVSVEQNEWSFVITNTYKTEQPTTPTTNANLPQTGQLWWPVSGLVFAGLCLVAIGVIRRRKNV
ncbi:MAG: Cna B-type domain-containing protein [Acutalibacteraceae bacterium]|nr:Cna B-type domain-containing protein [Acutalibacteraceae bacterium]